MLPTKPLNTDYLHNYSRELALLLSNKFFANTDIITGEQILEFSNIKQINFLIFKILEERWEAEAMRLESPFFDYSQPEVQDGLRTFLNVLSRHIRVQKKAFTAVLIEAIYGTLQLVLDPRSFYEQEIQKPAKIKLTAEYYRRSVKYIQYNREIFKTFVGELALRYSDTFQVEDALTVWHNTLRDHWRYIEPIEWRVKAFNSMLELSIDAIYTRATEAEVEVETVAVVDAKEEEKEEEIQANPTEEATPIYQEETKEEESIENITLESLPTAEEEEESIENITLESLPTLEEEKEEEKHEVETETTDSVLEFLPTLEEEVKEDEIVFSPVAVPTQEEEEDETTQYFAEIGKEVETPAQPDTKAEKENTAPEPDTIVSKYRQERVSSLLDAIPLHEKFTFIDELFGGDNLAFQDALEKIDNAPNYEDARRLTNQYILQFNWDFDRDSTQDFLAWLSRRF
jgi:DNA polymerase III gamma/tau subunit